MNEGIGIRLYNDRTDLGIGIVKIEVGVNKGLSSKHFDNADNCLGRSPRAVVIVCILSDSDIVRTNSKDDPVIAIHILDGDLVCLYVLHINVSTAIQSKSYVITALGDNTVEEIHLRSSDKSCNEYVVGEFVKVDGSIDLLNEAILHNYDARAHSHSLHLIVRDVNEGSTELFVEAGNFCSHRRTQLCIKVGEWLVKQEYLGLTDYCTSESNSLTLTAREGFRLSVKIFGNTEYCGSLHNLFVYLVLWHMYGTK